MEKDSQQIQNLSSTEFFAPRTRRGKEKNFTSCISGFLSVCRHDSAKPSRVARQLVPGQQKRVRVPGCHISQIGDVHIRCDSDGEHFHPALFKALRGFLQWHLRGISVLGVRSQNNEVLRRTERPAPQNQPQPHVALYGLTRAVTKEPS